MEENESLGRRSRRNGNTDIVHSTLRLLLPHRNKKAHRNGIKRPKCVRPPTSMQRLIAALELLQPLTV